MILTILTPSYNRAYILKKLYASLQEQSDKSFVWMVIDDGSTDDTDTLIQELSETADFPIQYVYKENGGKHTALNKGIELINTELTIIVDSDDCLMPDAVETIINFHQQFKDQEGLCGYSFMRVYPDGKIIGKPFQKEGMINSYIEQRINSNDMYSDKAEVFYTSVLREFPFPIFENERFLSEDVIWLPMGRKYKTVYSGKGIYICDYLEDGLTKNRRRNNIKSPRGCMYRASLYLENDICLRHRLRAGLQYWIYGWFAGERTKWLWANGQQKMILLICCLLARVLYLIWRRKYQ